MQVDKKQDSKRGLGRGLDALIPLGDFQGSSSQEGAKSVPIDQISPNPLQPRKIFNEGSLEELSQSIKEMGVIQPLIVTKKSNGGYELIAGERRLRASKLAGLTEVPIIERDASEIKKLELAITENVQRNDLNPIEEAYAYQELITNFSYTQEDLSRKLGKSRSTVTNKIRLLSLPAEAKKALREEIITEGHARAILVADKPEMMQRIFKMIVDGKLSVREAEEIAKKIKNGAEDTAVGLRGTATSQDPNVIKLEAELRNIIGLKTKIKTKNNGRGSVVIEYDSFEDLDNILNFFTKNNH